MITFTKNRLLIIAIVVLFILNITVLFTLWHTRLADHRLHPSESHAEDTEHQETAHFLQHELNLSQDQQHHLDSIRSYYFENSRRKVHEIHLLRRDMTKAAFEESPNLNQIRKWADRLGEIQADREFHRFSHFVQVRDLCTPDQRKKFEQLLHDALLRADPHPNVHGEHLEHDHEPTDHQ